MRAKNIDLQAVVEWLKDYRDNHKDDRFAFELALEAEKALEKMVTLLFLKNN